MTHAFLLPTRNQVNLWILKCLHFNHRPLLSLCHVSLWLTLRREGESGMVIALRTFTSMRTQAHKNIMVNTRSYHGSMMRRETWHKKQTYRL